MSLFVLIALAPVTVIADTTRDMDVPPWKAWQALLHSHVRVIDHGHASRVDYAGMLRDQSRLDDYVAALSHVTRDRFAGWNRRQQMAFLINAYNAYTVELVLTRWPNLGSLKEIGGWFDSAWKIRFFSLLGQRRNLEDIEAMLRDRWHYGDPRVHFAINCASIGCPMLQPFAYTGDQLDAQLRIATRDYLADHTRNRYEPADGKLDISHIFDWYAADFEHSRFHSVSGFLAAHADVLTDDPAARTRISLQHAPIAYLPYDWKLNGIQPSHH